MSDADFEGALNDLEPWYVMITASVDEEDVAVTTNLSDDGDVFRMLGQAFMHLAVQGLEDEE